MFMNFMPELERDPDYWKAIQIGIDLFEVDTYNSTCRLLENDGSGYFTVYERPPAIVAERMDFSICSYGDRFVFISG